MAECLPSMYKALSSIPRGRRRRGEKEGGKKEKGREREKKERFANKEVRG